MNEPTMMRVGAIQMEADLGNVDHNLEACERLADMAAAQGAKWIVLPEFFSTGIAFRPELSEHAPSPDGPPTQLLRDLAKRHGAHVGGSALVRDDDGHVRNAFFLASPTGVLIGRHDKDIPTMWENAIYVGGDDPGLVASEHVRIGLAVCWELMRTQTVNRLAGRCDLLMGGSGWWSMPDWPLLGRVEQRNKARAQQSAAVFARYVGAPLAFAAHAGRFSCTLPGTPLTYRGRFEGGAQVCDRYGNVLAFRDQCEGEGVVVADVAPGPVTPPLAPDRFWLQNRGFLPALAWTYQGLHGRMIYQRRTVERELVRRTT